MIRYLLDTTQGGGALANFIEPLCAFNCCMNYHKIKNPVTKFYHKQNIFHL